MRAIDIDPVLARLVWIFKHVRLTVGDMFPKGHVGIAHGDRFSVVGTLFLLGA